MTTLKGLLDVQKVPKASFRYDYTSVTSYDVEMYLIGIKGDVSKYRYGTDGEQPDSKGNRRSGMTVEKARTIADATAEVVSFQYFTKDCMPNETEDFRFYSSGHEYKQVYHSSKGPYILSAKNAGAKRVYLSEFKIGE